MAIALGQFIKDNGGGSPDSSVQLGRSYIRDYERNANNANSGLSDKSDEGFLGITALNKGDWQDETSGTPRTFDQLAAYVADRGNNG